MEMNYEIDENECMRKDLSRLIRAAKLAKANKQLEEIFPKEDRKPIFTTSRKPSLRYIRKSDSKYSKKPTSKYSGYNKKNIEETKKNIDKLRLKRDERNAKRAELMESYQKGTESYSKVLVKICTECSDNSEC